MTICREGPVCPAPKREQFIDEARALYVKGLDLSDIAHVIGVAHSSLRRWQRWDADHGRSWDEERRHDHKTRPDRVLRMLERRFGKKVLESQECPDTLGEDYEAKLLKMIQVINSYRKSADELTRQLLAMEEFAGYCAEHLSTDEVAVVRRAVQGFLDQLKRDNQ